MKRCCRTAGKPDSKYDGWLFAFYRVDDRVAGSAYADFARFQHTRNSIDVVPEVAAEHIEDLYGIVYMGLALVVRAECQFGDSGFLTAEIGYIDQYTKIDRATAVRFPQCFRA
jgi:hypothetical protein